MISSMLAASSVFDTPEAYPSYRTILLILTATFLPMLAATVVVLWALFHKRGKPAQEAPSAIYKIERIVIAGPRCPACDKGYIDDDLVLTVNERPLAHARCLAAEATKRPGKTAVLPLPRTDSEPSRPSAERVL